jgi:hypothetical protein
VGLDPFGPVDNDPLARIWHEGAVEAPIFSIWTFRGRKVVRLIFDPDRRKALEAAGLRE